MLIDIQYVINVNGNKLITEKMEFIESFINKINLDDIKVPITLQLKANSKIQKGNNITYNIINFALERNYYILCVNKFNTYYSRDSAMTHLSNYYSDIVIQFINNIHVHNETMEVLDIT